MQIFVLDEDIDSCAKYHCDKHVVKQILESCQLLCTTMRLHGVDYGYKPTHKNHPCRRWLDKSQQNFYWLKKMALCLCKEYTFRYNKTHKCKEIIEGTFCPVDIPNICMTDFALAMPDVYKHNDPIESYRKYYIGDKINILSYKRRKPPEWLISNVGENKIKTTF